MANNINSDKAGLVAFDGTDTFNGRTLTAGTAISVSNGDGVSGNPTVSAAATVPLTYTEDTGSATPAANVLTVSGGTGISTSGATDTLTTAVDTSVVTTSYAADSGSATPAAGVTTLAGGTNATTSATGNSVTINTTGGGAGGAVVFISSQTASSSTSIDFTGLTSTYIAYKIIYEGVTPGTDGVYLGLRTSTNNGASYDSALGDYSWATYGMAQVTSTSPSRSTGGGAGTYIRLTFPTTGTGTQENCAGEITLFNPSTANYTYINHYGSLRSDAGQNYQVRSGGVRESAADVDAIRLYFTSGNIASGTFKLYGISAT